MEIYFKKIIKPVTRHHDTEIACTQITFQTGQTGSGDNDKIVLKLQVLYTRDIVVETQNATKIVSSCATRIACVNGP